MTPKSTALILKLASLGTALFGLGLALLPHFGAGVIALFLDLAFLPLDGSETAAAAETQLGLAISGGLMVGLGAMIWQVATHVLPNNPRQAQRLLIPALLAWYVPDSLGSYLSGASFNVVMNTGFLALFLVPLMRMQRPAHQMTEAAPAQA